MSNKKQDLEDNPWFIGGIIAAVVLALGTLFYFMHQHEVESDKRYAAERAEYEKTRIVFGDYVKLTRLGCDEIGKTYFEKDLQGLSKFEKRLVTCGEIGKDFYLRYSLIRYKRTMYMVYLDTAFKAIPAEITKYNVPYCVVATDKAEIAVSEDCKRIP